MVLGRSEVHGLVSSQSSKEESVCLIAKGYFSQYHAGVTNVGADLETV